MKTIIKSLFRKALTDEHGQVLPWVALGLVGMLGAGGLSIDVGGAYVAHAQLQNYANAAALAAAGVVYNTSSTNNASAVANQYSASSGNQNVNSAIGTVQTTVTTKCLNLLMPAGTTCGTNSPANAVRVTEKASVPTNFMKLFGISKLSIAATATASMEGMAQPWNVAIIVDSTGSMATVDSNCGGLTEFQCALSGVQALLATVNPCPAGVTTCSGSSAHFGVSLFTFPNVLTSYNGTSVPSISNDINCNGSPATWRNYSSQPVAAPYTLPIPGVALEGVPNNTHMTYTETPTGHTWTATYQITPFLSDYYQPTSTSTGGLNRNSDLVKAVGYGNTSGCLTYTFGIWGTGSGSGFGNTYFASSIYEAQAALAAEQAAVPNSKNAIIFLSDGQANASYYSKNSSAYGTANSTNQFADAYQFPMGPKASTSLPYGSEVGPHVSNDPVPAYYTPATASTSYGYNTLGVNGKGIYPDWYDQCQQAVDAAQYAVSQGTTVFSVAYGSQGTGCSNGWSVGATDVDNLPKQFTVNGVTHTFTPNAPYSGNSMIPCQTMENIASSLNNFYSDKNQSGSNSTCQDASHTVSSLQDIFLAIAANFTQPRLIPNDAT